MSAVLIAMLPLQDAHAQIKFLDAAQIRPILDMTKGQWIALREYGGQDLLYFTHLLAWRCGLASISYSLNDSPDFKTWEMAPCNEDAPNTIPDTSKIYLTLPPKSVSSVTIRLFYDDNTTDETRFERKSILMTQ